MIFLFSIPFTFATANYFPFLLSKTVLTVTTKFTHNQLNQNNIKKTGIDPTNIPKFTNFGNQLLGYCFLLLINFLYYLLLLQKKLSYAQLIY